MTTPDPKEPDPTPPAIDPEVLKDSIREVLGDILPDFLTKEGGEPKSDDVDELDKPLTARHAEKIMQGLMKSAMAELNQKKPLPAPPKKNDDEPPAPKKKETEDPPKPPKKRASLSELFWGKND